MNTYLAIITTVLVITQVIRLIQNSISLQRQNKQLKDIPNITNEDIEMQKKAYKLIVERLEREDKENVW